MTFGTKLKLQAGFPAVYLFALSLIALLIPTYLGWRSYQDVLDWQWTALVTVLSVIALFSIFKRHTKQRKYSLQCGAEHGLNLIEARSGTDKKHQVVHSNFTLQTPNIVFASLQLRNGKKLHLVFHGVLNQKDIFRRFKVLLKWDKAFKG